ncbi:iron-containing alcohol dehydrogenase [Sulfuricurvum sp.]|uniref:iron-containing alcohol dehydrogenase n=1 Tax=Sulfuricurvum sp. TaxID=2025608 RepID=UPI003BAFAF8B
MQAFTYYNPTRIEFGRDKENNIGKMIAEQGITRLLLVYGTGSIKQNGLYDRVIQSLTTAGIAFEELDGVVSNPLLSRVQDGIDLVKSHNLQAVLGVGGGSVVDSAKAIAAGALYEGDVWDFFIQKASITAALPVYAVMTLAATASEMNGNSVVMNDVTKQKYSISSVLVNPKISIINPELMMTVTPEYLAYSATDIIAHTIEVYFTADDHPHFQSRLVESIIKTVIETTETLLKDPLNYDARAEFAWASTQALNGLTNSGTGGGSFPNHMIEHALSALFNIAHGAGLAIVIPAWMKWYKGQNPAQFERFAQEVFGLNTADEGIAALENWFDSIGAPVSLAAANISRERIGDIAENAHGLAVLWGMGEEYSSQTIATILQNA